MLLALLLTACTRQALPPDARATLDRYMQETTYRVQSAQKAPTPQNFAGVCSFFDPEVPAEMWCARVTGGHSFADHYILHHAQPVWNIIPVFDFDRSLFESIGCTNW